MNEELQTILKLLEQAGVGAYQVAIAYFVSKYLVVGITVLGCFWLVCRTIFKSMQLHVPIKEHLPTMKSGIRR